MIDRFGHIAGRSGFAAILVLLMMAVPARAATPVFPTGSRVGLVPPPGMTMSKTFTGFEDRDNQAVIVLGALPAAAYADMEKNSTDEVLKKQGLTVEKRETLQLAIGPAFLVVGTLAAPGNKKYRKWLLAAAASDVTALASVQAPVDSKIYSDSLVSAALATLALRGRVPEAEVLSLLPFTIGDLAGFRIENVIPGRAVMLVDGPRIPHMVASDGIPKYAIDARLMIAAIPGPNGDESRATVARVAFNTIPGIKDIQMTMSEPVRIDNENAFETVAHATDVRTGGSVMVVQWLRFGNGFFLQMAGVSRAEIWDEELTRLRTMRDSVHLR